MGDLDAIYLDGLVGNGTASSASPTVARRFVRAARLACTLALALVRFAAYLSEMRLEVLELAFA